MRTSPLESELAQEAVWNISLEGKCQEVTRLAERKVGGGRGAESAPFWENLDAKSNLEDFGEGSVIVAWPTCPGC